MQPHPDFEPLPRWSFTGRSRFRTGWFGRQILQVEEQQQPSGYFALETGIDTRWRDARPGDLAEVQAAAEAHQAKYGFAIWPSVTVCDLPTVRFATTLLEIERPRR